jgi:hypothetical protein
MTAACGEARSGIAAIHCVDHAYGYAIHPASAPRPDFWVGTPPLPSLIGDPMNTAARSLVVVAAADAAKTGFDAML